MWKKVRGTLQTHPIESTCNDVAEASVGCAGAVAPLDRRQAVYKVCQQYDVILLEDDPYFYLQFRRGAGGSPGGLDNLGTSYLSLDTDGRVIRLDSFAKVRL